jgi:cytidine deaminase
MTDRRLLETAADVMENSYSPYSRGKKGAAIECSDGSVFTGCLIENIALGTTICAETAALASAVSAGHRSFKRIATITEGNTYSYPCGTCRQLLSEFSPDIEILCARASDGRYVSYSLSALLPMPLSANEV